MAMEKEGTFCAHFTQPGEHGTPAAVTMDNDFC